MRKKTLAILIANLFIAAPALGQDAFTTTGSVSVGGMGVDRDAVDESKLLEYRDLTDSLLFGFDVRGRSTDYWLDAFGENIGKRDMFITLRGGRYDTFRYRLYTDAMRHEFLRNGRTPYDGAGTPVHTATFPRLDVNTWNPLDVRYKRRDDGGMFELQALSPFYIRVDANQVTWDGTKVGSSSLGLSPGNGAVDLAFPVDYKTTNTTLEAGYTSKRITASLSWMMSEFENNNETVRWTNGFFGNQLDTTWLPADNEYTRLAGNFTMRQLPLGSTLALRFTRDKLESETVLGTSVLHTGGTMVATGPNVPSFKGDVENKTFSAALSSNFNRSLDTRLFYNKHEREDNSSHLAFVSAPLTGTTTYRNEPFSYDKDQFGAEAFWRLNRANRFGVGFDYIDTEREGRHDFDRTKDKRFFVDWKGNFDPVTARVKYTRLKRDANFLLGDEGTTTGDALYLNRFVTAFDLSNVDQDTVKVALDFSPIQALDVSLEGIFKKNKFRDNVLGRLSDERQEVYVSASYGLPRGARLTVFGDVERVEYFSRHRTGVTGTVIGTYDPFAPPTATTYNWEGLVKDRNYAYGVAFAFPVMQKLTLTASAIYYKVNGSVDIALQEGVPASVTRPLSIGSWDDQKRTSFVLKGMYEVAKNWAVTAGYAYEKYDLSDEQVNNYRFTIPAANRQDTYFNGWNAFNDYKAHIFFGLVTYRF